MLYKFVNQKLEMEEFFDYEKCGILEKDLENILAQNLELIYEDCGLLTIFQERQFQPEPDILAVDKDGNLIIFELKRNFVGPDTTLQIMRYAQKYGRYNYRRLNELYQNYLGGKELKEEHREAFGLEQDLPDEYFNRHQKLFIIGNSSDTELLDMVDYWKDNGVDIDFVPFRFYKIDEEVYFEFFAKPYDYHRNPKDKVGIMFDTNCTYDPDAIWDMFANQKISAYDDKATEVNRFKQGDYVFYYHGGYGIVGAGTIRSTNATEVKGKNELMERYHTVNLLTPQVENIDDIRAISAAELKKILNHGFFFARTAKVPYLSLEESKILVKELRKRYNLEP